MTWGQQQRDTARESKLADIAEQIATGELVVRSMTDEEREKWAKRREQLLADSTSAERERRAGAVKRREQRRR